MQSHHKFLSEKIAKFNAKVVGVPTSLVFVSAVSIQKLYEKLGLPPDISMREAFRRTCDERLKYYTSEVLQDIPDAPPEITEGTMSKYLNNCREFRNYSNSLNKLSKKHNIIPGTDATCYKFYPEPALSGKTILIGCGDLGCCSDEFLGQVDYADPRFNGVYWQDIDFSLYDNIVSDVAHLNDLGTGMRVDTHLISRLMELACLGKRVIYKCSVTQAEHQIVAKVRPHNLEVICDTHATEGINLGMLDIVQANYDRNMVYYDQDNLEVPDPDLCDLVNFSHSLKNQANTLVRQNFSSKYRVSSALNGEFDADLFSYLIEEDYYRYTDSVPNELRCVAKEDLKDKIIENYSFLDVYIARDWYKALMDL